MPEMVAEARGEGSIVMAAQKRQCINCRFFQDAAMAGNGWCTHPKRQVDSSLRLMVRSRELACRNSWGGDLFSSKDGEDDARPDPLANPATDADHPHPAPVEDEVTSVITPPSRRSPHESGSGDADERSSEDRVVSDRPAPKRNNLRDDDDGRNDAARHDQDERARVMARGSSDAIARARERHLDRKRLGRAKQTGQEVDAISAAAEDDVVTTHTPALADSDDRVVTDQSRPSHRFSRRGSLKAKAETSLPEQPVPRSEVIQHQGSSATPDRYESVPEVDPNFDLPGWRRPGGVPVPEQMPEREPIQDTSPCAPVEQGPGHPQESPVTSYEHVLSRARRIRESKKPPRPHKIRMEPRHTGIKGENSADGIIAPIPHASDHEPIETAHVSGDEDEEYVSADALPDFFDPADGLRDRPQVSESVVVEEPRQQRRGWLAQFGINRRTRQDHSQGAVADVEADGGEAWFEAGPSDDRDSHDEDRGVTAAADDQQDEFYDSPDDDGHDESGEQAAPARYELPESPSSATSTQDSGVEWDESARQLYHRAESGRDYARYELPDLDVLFSAPPVYAAATVHERNELEPNSTTRNCGIISDNRDDETQSPSRSNRWPRESSSAPSESFFRAGRFRDWDQEHPARKHHPTDTRRLTEPADQDGDPGASSANPQILPDLDTTTFDLREVVERGGELLDMEIDVSPDVPRACRTCRSFRSADGGARGWCTNEWAFTHRRMVNEDDLACDTTIGCWWLPADRYWMIEDDASWSDATPKMDAFMARGSNPPSRKHAGE